jgi:hypothetical protein
MAWYNALPKKMQKLLDLWEENDIRWNGPAWDDEPHSVELECYTGAGEDMIINLHRISADDLEEYVNDFDINEEVSIWWEDGEPGRGCPFDNQAEHVQDYEDYLAWLRDIIDESRGKKRKKADISHSQQLYVDKFLAVVKDLEDVGVSLTWSKKKGFTFKNAA